MPHPAKGISLTFDLGGAMPGVLPYVHVLPVTTVIFLLDIEESIVLAAQETKVLWCSDDTGKVDPVAKARVCKTAHAWMRRARGLAFLETLTPYNVQSIATILTAHAAARIRPCRSLIVRVNPDPIIATLFWLTIVVDFVSMNHVHRR